MNNNIKTYCYGAACPIKRTCLRYTQGMFVTMSSSGTDEKFIRHCTNQKKYMQDERYINTDSKKTSKV